MTTPPVDTSREAIGLLFNTHVVLKCLSAFDVQPIRNMLDALRTALDAAEGRPIPTAGFDEHDSKIIADLEVLGADRDSGFWPPMIALGVRRILIRTIAQRDAEKARADRLAEALKEYDESFSELDSSRSESGRRAQRTRMRLAVIAARHELATKDSPT